MRVKMVSNLSLNSVNSAAIELPKVAEPKVISIEDLKTSELFLKTRKKTLQSEIRKCDSKRELLDLYCLLLKKNRKVKELTVINENLKGIQCEKRALRNRPPVVELPLAAVPVRENNELTQAEKDKYAEFVIGPMLQPFIPQIPLLTAQESRLAQLGQEGYDLMKTQVERVIVDWSNEKKAVLNLTAAKVVELFDNMLNNQMTPEMKNRMSLMVQFTMARNPSSRQ